MRNLFLAILISLSAILFMSCSSTDSGHDDLILKNVLTASNWYFADEVPSPFSSTDYYRFVFRENDGAFFYSAHNFPCGSSQNYIERGSFSVEDNLILLAFDVEPTMPDTLIVESFSETQIEIKQNVNLDFGEFGSIDFIEFTLVANCEDL